MRHTLKKRKLRALRLRADDSPGLEKHLLERLMLAEISALHQEWYAAAQRALQAERTLMESLRGDRTPDALEIEAVCALRADASRRLQTFLAATEAASRNCGVSRP